MHCKKKRQTDRRTDVQIDRRTDGHATLYLRQYIRIFIISKYTLERISAHSFLFSYLSFLSSPSSFFLFSPRLSSPLLDYHFLSFRSIPFILPSYSCPLCTPTSSTFILFNLILFYFILFSICMKIYLFLFRQFL